MVKSQFNKFKEDKLRVILEKGQCESVFSAQKGQGRKRKNTAMVKEKLMLPKLRKRLSRRYTLMHMTQFVMTYPRLKRFLMANLSSWDLEVLSEDINLEEEKSIKMLVNRMIPIYVEKKIKISPIDYSKYDNIRRLLFKSHTPVRIEAPSELPKVLKDTFNAFDKTLLDEITKVQTVFNQMKAAVDQCSVDKNVFEIQIKQLRIDNDQLLNQIIKCLELETELLKKRDFIEKVAYDKLVKSYSTLEKHCISLELATQLNQEIFQRENSGENLNAPTFNQLVEINKLKAQSQEKGMVIRKLKDMIKSLSGKDCVENVKKDIDEIETINIELEHRVKTTLVVVQIVLWYLDSRCSKHMTGNRSQLMNFVSKFLGTVRFGNDQIARIMGYGDYQLGNVVISRVYYVEGLGHNLFSVGQFCDADLEVAFRKNTCFIRNLEGVDLLSGSRDTNLYTISLDDMLRSSPICLLSKASKTKSWLWHRRLSHLNFGTLNKQAGYGTVDYHISTSERSFVFSMCIR
ncbi:retrovirus-related pol polyprotein from transposon TNT 1-94 [Tanacetum coccineum]